MFDSMNMNPNRGFSPLDSLTRGRKPRHQPFFATEHGRRGKRRGGRFPEQREHRNRVPRGDIKYILLGLLAEKPQHGYQLIKEIESRWGGFYRPSPGSVYPTLQLLEEETYLTSEQLEGKKIYTITERGKNLLAQHPSSMAALERLDEQPQLIALKTTLRDLREVIMQVTRSGNQKHIDQVLTSLKKLKREIYLMLAEEEV